MAASPNITSHGEPMIFTQSEATAAQRTWPFFLTNSADGTPATGKTIATTDFKISKAGGAFGNAVGAVTEISLGWYKMVFDVGDLDTVGALACELSGEAGVDPIHCTHQVSVLDLNVATVNPGANGLTAAALAADAVAEIQSGLATGSQVQQARTGSTVLYNMGTLEADGSTVGISLRDAISAVVALTGTWDGATVTVQETADPLADPIVWTTYTGGAKTADGNVAITGPVAGLRCTMSDDGATSEVACNITIQK